MIAINRTDASDPDFISLVALLDRELKVRDGEDHAFYNQFNRIDMLKNVVVCYDNDQPAGCGAFKPFDAGSVEIKRMYVHTKHRRKGIAARILSELEHWAASMNYNYCILETGKKQPEAIALYEKAGYHRIKNYGQYEGVDNSICMKKKVNETSS